MAEIEKPKIMKDLVLGAHEPKLKGSVRQPSHATITLVLLKTSSHADFVADLLGRG